MKIIPSCDPKDLAEKYIYIDNDFLSAIYKDHELLKEVLLIFKDSILVIDTITEFEFLRDIYVPRDIENAKDFLEKEWFTRLPKNQEIYLKVMDSALFLSSVYKHQDKEIQGRGKGKGVSLADLMLAGILMKNSDSSLLATGNTKDFPPCLFDVECVISYRQGNGGIRPISVLSFNNKKLLDCIEKMERLQENTEPKQTKTPTVQR